jgi:hypothetical protein
MVSHHRNEPEFMCERVDMLKRLFWVVAPVEDVAEIDYNINGAKMLNKRRFPDPRTKGSDCSGIGVHI